MSEGLSLELDEPDMNNRIIYEIKVYLIDCKGKRKKEEKLE